jgi:drug/metabolite transporter (DMT)-like permease
LWVTSFAWQCFVEAAIEARDGGGAGIERKGAGIVLSDIRCRSESGRATVRIVAMKYYFVFPLISSLLYVVGVMFMKQCSGLGVGIWRTSFVSNIATALLFVPVLGFGGVWRPWTEYWQPALAGLMFVGGQTFTFVALRNGDVTVATPVMGLKTVLVGLLVTGIIGDTVSPRLWVSAGLSAAGIALLNVVRGVRHRHVGGTIMLSMVAASCFALFDVLVQKFSPAWGIGRFLPVMFGWVTVFSFGFQPFFSAPLSEIPREAWKSLGWGSTFLALQGLVLICTLGHFGDATAVNVIYSSRGLWSVVAVWLVGHWFSNQERQLGGGVFRWRAAGAAMMLIAIILTLV